MGPRPTASNAWRSLAQRGPRCGVPERDGFRVLSCSTWVGDTLSSLNDSRFSLSLKLLSRLHCSCEMVVEPHDRVALHFHLDVVPSNKSTLLYRFVVVLVIPTIGGQIDAADIGVQSVNACLPITTAF